MQLVSTNLWMRLLLQKACRVLVHETDLSYLSYGVEVMYKAHNCKHPHQSCDALSRDLTADLLRSTGFQDPILVKPCENIAVTHEASALRCDALRFCSF